MRLYPPGTHFTAESTEAMRIKCLTQGNNILLPGFEPSTSVSKTDILTNRPICSKTDCHLVMETTGSLSTFDSHGHDMMMLVEYLYNQSMMWHLCLLIVMGMT